MVLKSGMVFRHDNKTIKILEIQGNLTRFIPSWVDTVGVFPTEVLVDSLKDWQYEEKPLDKAMKILDKQFCLHKNVKRDIYFTAKVFLTCRDCGKAMN